MKPFKNYETEVLSNNYLSQFFFVNKIFQNYKEKI